MNRISHSKCLSVCAAIVLVGCGADARPKRELDATSAQEDVLADSDHSEDDVEASDAPSDVLEWDSTTDSVDEELADTAELDTLGVRDSDEPDSVFDVMRDTLPDTRPPFADEDFCEEVRAFGPVFGDTVAEWERQDDLSAPPSGGLLLVGSSSARRWDTFARRYAAYSPLQRGFGGAQLGEVALFAEELVTRHDPAAVAVFAGTNDVASGVSPEIVLDRFRCLRQQIGNELGWDTPVLFIGITPTPLRWGGWEQANELNELVRALESIDPALRYVDVPALFLATSPTPGEPPARELFAADNLHLSQAGYDLWDEALRPVVESVLDPMADSPADPLPSGTRLLVDVGPDDGTNGEVTPTPDYLEQTWNNWHSLAGGARALPGHHLDDLLADDGTETGLSMVISGGFVANGWQNGGVRWPTQDLLGELAVGSATGDFFYADDDDITGAFRLAGLSPEQSFTLRLFAGRTDDERRVTEFRVFGDGEATQTVQTSGPGSGTSGNGNDDDVVEFTGVLPDAWGNIHVELAVADGRYAYVSLVELVVED